ncbi:MAG TPA: hypothetical protein VG897_01690 [Terriglobales bacterium]|nr:hypothetical protein [Terriglobales bacterium]
MSKLTFSADTFHGGNWYNYYMDVERTIAEIELLERLFALPDSRGISAAEREAANRRHDQAIASNPWFRVWQQFGLPR